MEIKEVSISEILKDCPEGTELYSTAFGYLKFVCVMRSGQIECMDRIGVKGILFSEKGALSPDGECVLFPSKDQRDWSRFEKPVVPPFKINPPKPGEVFFLIDALGEVNKIEDKQHLGIENYSIRRGFELGNYFNTKSQAEYAAKKVKELLLSLRKEVE